MHFRWLKKPISWLRWTGISSLIIGSLILVFGGYAFHWAWTGFQKTLWDWMQLLIIPVALAITGFLLTRAEHRREKAVEEQKMASERQAAEQKAQWDRHFADQKAMTERWLAQWRLEAEIKQKEEFQREALLQAYLDRMADLLIEKGLRNSEPVSDIRLVARAQTIMTLQRLDIDRKKDVLWFLYESHLLGEQNVERIVDVSDTNWNTIDLKEANLAFIDLRDVNLSHALMTGAVLRGARLCNADLTQITLNDAALGGAKLKEAILCQANLQGANLNGADLIGADLRKADLKDASLRGAQLQGACLAGADLTGADLTNAKLQKADLTDARFVQANLRNSILRDAVLQRANLSQANLQGARYTEDQLTVAYGRWNIIR